MHPYESALIIATVRAIPHSEGPPQLSFGVGHHPQIAAGTTMTNRTIAVLVLLITCPALIPAQAARMGRLAVLAPLASGAACSSAAVSGELKDAGIDRLLSITEPNHPRLLSLAVSARGKPRMLTVLMSTQERRRGEGESVTVHFELRGRSSVGRALPIRQELLRASATIVGAVSSPLIRCRSETWPVRCYASAAHDV